MFRIVHISDLHFKNDLYQPRVITALCADIESLKAISPIGAIIFSGDLAAKGDTSKEEVEKILAQFVSQIRAAAGLDVLVLVCPGNHDIDLKKKSSMFAPVFAGVTTPTKANDLVKAAIEPEARPLWAHIEGFRSLAKEIDGDAFSKHPLFYTKKVSLNGVRVGFACLNSAWMTKGGGNADYGQLYVGEYLLDLAAKELEDVDVRIAVMHHPLDWLAPEEKTVIQRFLTLNFHGYFCGHKHDNNAESLNSNIGNLFTSNTGCVYHSNEYFNGYSCIDLDLANKKWILRAREYYFQREKFDVATRFAANGFWETPFGSTWNSIQIAIPGEVTRAINERANSLLLSYVASDVAPKSIGALFVEPPLSGMSEKELIAKSKSDKVPKSAYESLASLGKRNEALLFIGKREAGKSLLLHHIAVNCFQSFRGNARLGVVVDINGLKRLTEATVLEQAVEFCGGEIPRRDLVKLLSAGEIVVCIDNIRAHDQKTVNLVRSFVTQYPLVRYVFAMPEELLDILSGNKIPDLGILMSKVFVHSFRARHTKELIGRWFGSNDLALKRKVQNVNLLLDRLRVPRTPFLVSVLSWVLEQRPDANVVNRASAIEVLIEGLLGKFKESKARKEFDSTIQQHFLAEFALHLNERDFYWVGRLDFDEFAVTYFKKRGLTVSTDGFAFELIRKGILFATDKRVGFKFDCFRAFFLAKKFAEIPELWRAALQPASVSRYVTELDLFTGLHRDRAEVLRVAKDLCIKTYSELKMEFDLGEIDRISFTGLLADPRFLEKVETNLLVENHPTAELTHEAPDAISADHEESRRRRFLPDMGDFGRFLESLRTFSMILRNSELVDDIELKRESFEIALEQWANTTITAILATIEQAQKVRLKYPDGKVTDLANREMEVVAIAKAMIPQMIISVMGESLATPKLELFVHEKTTDKRTLVRALAVFLAFDSEDSSAVSMGKVLLRDFRNNGFVLEMLFFKLLSIYLNRGSEEANPKLRDLIGDVVIQLRGASAIQASTMKARFLGGLDKNFLVHEFNEKT